MKISLPFNVHCQALAEPDDEIQCEALTSISVRIAVMSACWDVLETPNMRSFASAAHNTGQTMTCSSGTVPCESNHHDVRFCLWYLASKLACSTA